MQFGLTAEQIAARRLGLGGSDAAKVMSGDWLALWEEKTPYCRTIEEAAKTPPRRASKAIMSPWDACLRHLTEKLQLDWYEHTTGRTVYRRGESVVSAEHPFMGVTLDGMIEVTGQPINAKHVSGWTKKAIEWCQEHYAWQTTHEGVVCQNDYPMLSVLVGEKEPIILVCETNPFHVDELIEREAAFWDLVVRDIRPDGPQAVSAPPTLIEVSALRKIDLSDENKDRWPNWGGDMIREFGEFALTKAHADRHFIAREEIKKLLPEDVGEVLRGNIAVKRTKAGSITIALKKASP